MRKFEICVKGHEVEIEVEDEEIWRVLEENEGVKKEDFEVEGYESEDEYLADLVEDKYTELCEYFEETKADDIAANWEMDEEVERFYRYGRNY